VKYAQYVKIWSFDALYSISEALCSIYMHTTESGLCSSFDGRKRALQPFRPYMTNVQ
jgi:hypothetical protein